MGLKAHLLTRVVMLAGLLLFPLFLTVTEGHAQQPPIAVGTQVEVSTAGGVLNLRADPGLDESIVATLPAGTVLQVVGGPQSRDGHEWWELQGEPGSGWATGRYLRVVAPGPEPMTRPATAFPSPGPAPAIASPAAPSPAATRANAGRHIADVYGFSGWCFLGWRWPTRDNMLPVSVDAAATYKQVKPVNDLLLKAGYTSRLHEDATAAEALEHLPEDEVFVFFGHGFNEGIVFHDQGCSHSALHGSQLASGGTPNLRLALLVGCSTGQDLTAEHNLMRRFQQAGATKVIGFNANQMGIMLNHWLKVFRRYALEDGMEVGDAARKATLDNIHGYYWVLPGDLVVLGDRPVYLKVVEEQTTSVDEQIEAVAQGWLDRLTARLQALWESMIERFERGIEELIERLLQSLLRKLEQIVSQFFAQLCGTPVALVPVVGAYPLWRSRQRQSRER